jgi:hypothetical protein
MTAPARVNKKTRLVRISGLLSMGPSSDASAALLLLLAVVEPVTVPEPGAASVVLVPLAFCEPSPLRPGPDPAPDFMNYAHFTSVPATVVASRANKRGYREWVLTALAPSGMAGRAVPLTSQLASDVGQACELVVATAPPLPVGAGYFDRAVWNLANSGSSLTELPLSDAMPKPLGSTAYSYMRPPE